MTKIKFHLIAIAFLSILTTSCSDETSDPSPAQMENTATNLWVYSEMKDYYYWTDKMPATANVNLATEDFFESLLYKTEDRFSWIQNSTDLHNMLNGISKATGFEMKLYPKIEGSSDLVGQIIYVFPNTPASRAGIKRGDLFTTINGQQLTMSNYATLLFGEASYFMNIGFVKYVDAVFTNDKVVQVISDEIVQNPIIMDSIYTINSTKIGYFAYKNFIPDAGDGSLSYDNKFIEIFGKFKSAGINELVLDLRWNTGGALTSATKLASLIVHGATSNDIMGVSKYNTPLTDYLRTQKENYFTTNFIDEPNNVGSSISRVVVLTGNSTASASELIINCLRPYMDVYLVGNTTYGKNVGSITITDQTNKIQWGIQPIVVKLYNKNNESNYTNGFTPNIVDTDRNFIIYPLGDLRETLLRKALNQIYGISTDNLPVLKSASTSNEIEIASSISHRRELGLWMDR